MIPGWINRIRIRSFGVGIATSTRVTTGCMKILLLALALLPPVAAEADGFTQQCERLAAGARIEVLFEEPQVTRDDSRSRDELMRLSQSSRNPNHAVLGLTQAEPSFNLRLAPAFLTHADGRVCAALSLTLKLGFSNLQVYLARELNGACRRDIVLTHEQEHVAVWRDHLRAGARLLQPLLQTSLGQPGYFSRRDEAEAALLSRANTLIKQKLDGLREGIRFAHQQIDSPASYRHEENRMRACP